jgi:hypothetical protein
MDIPKSPNPESELTTIGTATFRGAAYKLIWENDNNGNSIIWLDYTRGLDGHDDQLAWAAGLNEEGVLTCTIDPAYSVNWDGDWRLPSVGSNPRRLGSGAASSELGHLFHVELGLDYVSHGDGYDPYKKADLYAAGVFDHLVPSKYWCAEIYEEYYYPHFSWYFDMSNSKQDVDRNYPDPEHGFEYENSAIAVRNASVIDHSAVDSDGDSIADYLDNCPLTSNADQSDTDGDGYGNMCDCDIDGDGSVALSDYLVFKAAFGAYGGDGRSVRWNADADFNGDLTVDLRDYLIFKARFGSAAPFE